MINMLKTLQGNRQYTIIGNVKREIESLRKNQRKMLETKNTRTEVESLCFLLIAHRWWAYQQAGHRQGKNDVLEE